MNYPFKPGDKIRRKKEYLYHADWNLQADDAGFKPTAILTVTQCNNDGLRFKEWVTLRTTEMFELATPIKVEEYI